MALLHRVRALKAPGDLRLFDGGDLTECAVRAHRLSSAESSAGRLGEKRFLVGFRASSLLQPSAYAQTHFAGPVLGNSSPLDALGIPRSLHDRVQAFSSSQLPTSSSFLVTQASAAPSAPFRCPPP